MTKKIDLTSGKPVKPEVIDTRDERVRANQRKTPVPQHQIHTLDKLGVKRG
jgi:hypothetical protein